MARRPNMRGNKMSNISGYLAYGFIVLPCLGALWLLSPVLALIGVIIGAPFLALCIVMAERIARRRNAQAIKYRREVQKFGPYQVREWRRKQ